VILQIVVVFVENDSKKYLYPGVLG